LPGTDKYRPIPDAAHRRATSCGIEAAGAKIVALITLFQKFASQISETRIL
jgi:hypothetical protein